MSFPFHLAILSNPEEFTKPTNTARLVKNVNSDVEIIETAKAAEFFLSDGVILTGTSTGKETDIDELKKVRDVVNIPVLIGSGLTADNIEKYFPAADAFIIGSYFKKGGNWQNEVDADRVKALMDKINKLR